MNSFFGANPGMVAEALQSTFDAWDGKSKFHIALFRSPVVNVDADPRTFRACMRAVEFTLRSQLNDDTIVMADFSKGMYGSEFSEAVRDAIEMLRHMAQANR